MSHSDTLGLAKGPFQLPKLSRRRWAVTSQAAGGTTDTGTLPATAGTQGSLEHGRAPSTTHLVGFFIASYHAHSLDEGVARIVDTCLDALVQGPAIWGCFVTEPGVDGWRQVAGHAVVVLPQVRVLSAVGGETNESFGARGPQRPCPCPTETRRAGVGRGAVGREVKLLCLSTPAKASREWEGRHWHRTARAVLSADIATRTTVHEQIWTGC